MNSAAYGSECGISPLCLAQYYQVSHYIMTMHLQKLLEISVHPMLVDTVKTLVSETKLGPWQQDLRAVGQTSQYVASLAPNQLLFSGTLGIRR